MDLETVKKLNEMLSGYGYTVGRIAYEISLFNSAIEFAERRGEIGIVPEVAAEYNEMMFDSNENNGFVWEFNNSAQWLLKELDYYPLMVKKTVE